MRLVLLGTAGYHPSERRHTPCLLLPDCGVMLDAGTAVFRAGEYLVRPELDIFISHAHLDHVVGLTFLYSVLHVHPLERITLHGLPECLRAVEEHLFSESLFPAKPPFELMALAEGDRPIIASKKSGQSPKAFTLVGDGKLTYFPLEHRGPSIGFRLEWPGHSMAYVTDTTADEHAAYVEAVRGVDLLVHECFFNDAQAEWSRKVGHSNTTPVAQVARRAGVKRLVLVHLNPVSQDADPVGLDVARAIFPNTILGEDRMELEF
jgi:ribonuclease BN (tRNA processing enzyme)